MNRKYSNYLAKSFVVPLDIRILSQFEKQPTYLAPLEPKKRASEAGAQKYFEKISFDFITKKTKVGIEDSFTQPHEDDLQNFIVIE